MRSLYLACFALVFASCALPAVENGAVSCPTGVGCGSRDLSQGDNGSDVDLAQAAPSDLSSSPVSDLVHAATDLAQPAAPDLATGSSCAHSICAAGGKLASSCDPCATQVCAKDSYCCATQWNSICVGEVSSVCGRSCP